MGTLWGWDDAERDKLGVLVVALERQIWRALWVGCEGIREL